MPEPKTTQQKITTALAWIFGALVIIWLCKSIISTAPQPQVQTPGIKFSNRICPDAYASEVHHDNDLIPYFDVNLGSECFSGFIGFPRQWQRWQIQMLGNNNDDWYMIWFRGWNGPKGPFTAQQANNGNLEFGNVPSSYGLIQARVEGKGTLRFYRITP
jgi:hypothetical protein